MATWLQLLQQHHDKSVYKYPSLPGPTWTRVVTLQPRVSGRVEILLDTLNLADANHQAYTAISYAWQGQTPTERITCNGRHLKISKTLLSCLRYMRDHSSPVVLWADAICINQAESSAAMRERSQQVQMIGAIFSMASNVVAFLGPEQRGDRDAFYGLSFLASFEKECWEEKMSTASSAISSGSSDAIERYVFFEELDQQWPEGLDSFLFQLRHLLDRPFFSRLWIVQELVMAKNFDLAIGYNRIHSSIFRIGLDRIAEFAKMLARIISVGWVSESRSLLRWLQSCLQRKHRAWENGMTFAHQLSLVDGVFEARQNYQNSINASTSTDTDSDQAFVELIRSTRYLKTTDPKDYIFAVVGLSNDPTAPELQIDYTISAHILTERVARYMIKISQGLALLLEFCCAATPEGHGWRFKLGWSATNSLWSSSEKHVCLFNAHGATAFVASFIDANDRATMLSLTGESLGLIDGVCDLACPMFVADDINIRSTASVNSWGLKQGPRFYRWFEDTSRWVTSQQVSHHGNHLATSFEENCWRVIFADILVDERLARAQLAWSNPNYQYDGDSSADQATPQIDYANVMQCSHIAATNKLLPGVSLRAYQSLLWDTSRLILEKAAPALRGRKLGRAGSRPCLLPGTTQSGDEVCVIHGCPLPLVLRPLADGSYIYIGTCYIDGMMNGEALLRPRRIVRTFELWPGDGPDDI